jgi:hypothetical protein
VLFVIYRLLQSEIKADERELMPDRASNDGGYRLRSLRQVDLVALVYPILAVGAICGQKSSRRTTTEPRPTW